MSLFELPVSRGARMARVVAVLLLDLVLAGAGIAMIVSYLNDRAEAAERAEPTPIAEEPAPRAEVDALEPAPVDPKQVRRAPSKPARRIADESEPRRPGGSRAPRAEPDAESVDPPDPEPADGVDSDIDMEPGPVTDPGGEPEPDPDPDTHDGDDGTLDPDPGEEVRVEFSAAKVRRVVDRHRVQLQKCYQRATKHASPSKPLEGRVDIQFVIMPDGTASSVRPVANTTGSDQLASCVKGLIESWQFPSPGAEEIAFVWPFVFKAP